MYLGLHVKCPLILSHFTESWIFSRGFRKILKFHENHPLGAESFHADGQTQRRTDTHTDGRTDGQTDTDSHEESNSLFSQFCESGLK